MGRRPVFKFYPAPHSKKYKLSYIQHRRILGAEAAKDLKKACITFEVSTHLAQYYKKKHLNPTLHSGTHGGAR
jgi:hypothetical protein